MRFALLPMFFFFLLPPEGLALEYGECQAIPDSKKYIRGNFHSSYPKEVIFQCAYDCYGEKGVEKILGVSKVKAGNFKEDGTKVVCQGVAVRVSGGLFQYEGVHPFYAYDANSPEVKKWAFQQVSRDNPIEIRKLTKLKELLEQVSVAYIKAGSDPRYAYYREAGLELQEISSQLPNNTKKLDQALIGLSDSSREGNAKDSLVKSVLLNAAGFRIP